MSNARELDLFGTAECLETTNPQTGLKINPPKKKISEGVQMEQSKLVKNNELLNVYSV